MDNVMQLVDLVSGKIGELASSELVVGEPIVVGKVTLVPLSAVSVGLGGGGGEGEGDFDGQTEGRGGRRHPHPPWKRGKGTGAGVGAGGKIRPVAVVVFTETGVRVETVPDRKGLFEKLFDRIPELAGMANRGRGGER